LTTATYRVVKRVTDVTLSLVGLAVTAPLQAGVAIAVWARLGRPVLFRQRRPGQSGRPFTLVKFRTMTQPEPGREPLEDAERMTSLGRVLRATSLDELPTLWNVIRGDMSLVGPRPLLMEYLPMYTAEQRRRHDVKPGITGLAQVSGRNALPWSQRLALDTQYVDSQSAGLDLRILVRTVVQVLRRDGITSAGQVTVQRFDPAGTDLR
jgi:lipopolysaccharide/colanic/teichoic acid biosynthesis glycosyltransferase